MFVRYLADAKPGHGYTILGLEVTDRVEIKWEREADRKMVQARMKSGKRFMDSEWKSIDNPGVDEALIQAIIK